MKRIVEERLVFEDGELMSGFEQDAGDSAEVYLGLVLTVKRRFGLNRRIRHRVMIPWELAIKFALNTVRHAEEAREITRAGAKEGGDDE